MWPQRLPAVSKVRALTHIRNAPSATEEHLHLSRAHRAFSRANDGQKTSPHTFKDSKTVGNMSSSFNRRKLAAEHPDCGGDGVDAGGVDFKVTLSYTGV